MKESIAKPDTTKLHQLPTGHGIEEYEGWEEWTNIRWAWEFLRRNREYQKLCREFEENDVPLTRRNAIVRKDFGLIRFKDFREPFEGNEVKPPRFLSAGIQSWARITKKQQRQRGSKPSLRIRPGEVLIKFDVRVTEKTSMSIDGQLRAAKKLLAKRADQWLTRKKKAKKALPRQRLDGRDAIELLRLLDLIAINDKRPKGEAVSNTKLYEVLYPRWEKPVPGQKGTTSNYLQPFERKRQRALKYSKQRYLDLAAFGVSTANKEKGSRRK